MAKITKDFVNSTNKPGTYRDDKLKGFCLKITNAGKKVYLVNNKLKGSRKNVTITIGRHGPFTPETARDEAKVILAELSQGINRNKQNREHASVQASERAEREEQQRVKSITLRKVFYDFIQSRNLKSSTEYGYDKILKRCLSDWLDLPIVEITKDMVERRHRALSVEHKAQANYTMRVLRALIAYADVAYEYQGSSIVPVNPVKRLSQVKAWNRIPRRQDVIKDHELKPWYEAVMKIKNDTIRDYLRLVLFTGLRKEEAAQLKWVNVDRDARTIKVEDTKNHEDHMLPMTDYIYDLISERWQKRENEFVFSGEGITGHLIEARKQMKQVTKKSGVLFSIHTLRRTFLTTADCLDIPHYALKRLANHKSNADVTAGYIIADAKRLEEPMKKITAYFEQKFEIAPKEQTRILLSSNVVPLVRAG